MDLDKITKYKNLSLKASIRALNFLVGAASMWMINDLGYTVLISLVALIITAISYGIISALMITSYDD